MPMSRCWRPRCATKRWPSRCEEIYLAPLGGEKDGAVARKTLRAYFAAGRNAATAAAALGVDRHTVERRLHSIETRLGRLLHTCHAELEVALRLEELGDGAEHRRHPVLTAELTLRRRRPLRPIGTMWRKLITPCTTLAHHLPTRQLIPLM